MKKRLLAELKVKMNETSSPSSATSSGLSSSAEKDEVSSSSSSSSSPNQKRRAEAGSSSENIKAHETEGKKIQSEEIQTISKDEGGGDMHKNGGDYVDDKSCPTEGISSRSQEEKHKEKVAFDESTEPAKDKHKAKAKAKKKKQSESFRQPLPPLTAAVVDGDLATVQKLVSGKEVEDKQLSKKKKQKRSKSVGDGKKRKIKKAQAKNQKDKERRYSEGQAKTKLKKDTKKSLTKERLLENDYMGATALHHACNLSDAVEDRDAIIDCLGEAMQRTACLYPIFSGLPSGKEVRKRLGTEGETPMHIAAKLGFVHALEVLLVTVFGSKATSVRGYEDEPKSEEGTKIPYAEFPNLKDLKGRTPTHLAAEHGHYDCLVLLLARDAALDNRDLEGLSPLDMALAKGHMECVMFLEKEGAGIDTKYCEDSEDEDEDDKRRKAKRKRQETHKHVRELEASDNQDQEEWEVDNFGWKIKPPSDDEDEPLHGANSETNSKTEKNRNKVRAKKDKKYTKKWKTMTNKERKYFATEKHAGLLRRMTGRGGMVENRKRKKAVKLARKGIPIEQKGKIWAKLLEVDEWRSHQTSEYEPNSWGSKFVKQIDLDIARTHREHILFKERFNHKQCQLFRILRAYSVYDKELGYTQGMSDVVGLLLMYNDDEEEVFWMLDILMNRFEFKELFRPGFPRLMENFHIHDLLLKEFLPQVYNHLQEQGIHVSTYTTKWYLMVFLNLPFESVLRVWDVVLAEGYQLSFCIALAILEMFQGIILSLDFEATILFLQNLDRRKIDNDRLIKGAINYKRKLKPHHYKKLEDLRTDYRANS